MSPAFAEHNWEVGAGSGPFSDYSATLLITPVCKARDQGYRYYSQLKMRGFSFSFFFF